MCLPVPSIQAALRLKAAQYQKLDYDNDDCVFPMNSNLFTHVQFVPIFQMKCGKQNKNKFSRKFVVLTVKITDLILI